MASVAARSVGSPIPAPLPDAGSVRPGRPFPFAGRSTVEIAPLVTLCLTSDGLTSTG